jgi:hypothetical protein
MLKKFMVFFIACLMLVLSGTAVFAAAQSEGGATLSNMLITKDQAATMTKEDMKIMCKAQTTAMIDKKSMDKMMVMMTVDQFNLMMDNLFTEDMFKDQMIALGTKDQWMMLSKDQKNAALDKMMLNMTPEQMGTMKNEMMLIMTKEQMVSIMEDHTNAMLITGSALEPLKEDMMMVSQGQSMILRDKLFMDKMMTVMTNDQMSTMVDSMKNDMKDQMMTMGTKEQWAVMDKDQIMVTIDKMMMTMTQDQMSKMTEKMMVIMTKDQMTTIMMANTNTMQKVTLIVTN